MIELSPISVFQVSVLSWSINRIAAITNCAVYLNGYVFCLSYFLEIIKLQYWPAVDESPTKPILRFIKICTFHGFCSWIFN